MEAISNAGLVLYSVFISRSKVSDPKNGASE